MKHFWLAVVCGATTVALAMSACGGDRFVPFEEAGGSGGSSATGGDGGDATGGSASGGNANGGTSSTGGSSTTGGSGGAGDDCPGGCGVGLECCDGKCVNLDNDVNNCGGCNKECDGAQPFCNQGICGDPPCNGDVCIGTTFCCGMHCCELDQLCCVVPGGPVGPPECYDPVEGTCPVGNPGGVCAHPDTRIATPSGERAIASLRVGDLVYSVEGDGIVAVPIARVARRRVQDHRVMHIRLDDGAELFISAPHPLADGRTVGDLVRGDSLLGPMVESIALVPYEADFTYDILPNSETGTYFASGAVMGSTLR